MSIQIEKGIPVPTNAKGAIAKVNRHHMEVGDSYFLAEEKSTAAETNRTKAWKRLHQPTWKFTHRKVEGGIRVWRIA